MSGGAEGPVATARHWMGLLGRAVAGFRRDGCFQLAAGIAYFAILSFIPLTVLLLTFVTLVIRSSRDLTDLLFEALQTYFPVIPSSFIQQVGDLLEHAGTLGGLAFLFLFFSAMMMFEAVQNGLNRVFHSEGRRFIGSRLVSLGMTLSTCVLLATILIITVVTAAMANMLEGLGPLDVAATIVYKFLITYAAPLLVTALVFTVAIKGVPNTRVGLKPALIGGFFGGTLWEVAKHIFTWYVGSVAPFHLIYGSLGASVIILLWIQYSASLLLLSAELAAVLNAEAAGRTAGSGNAGR